MGTVGGGGGGRSRDPPPDDEEDGEGVVGPPSPSCSFSESSSNLRRCRPKQRTVQFKKNRTALWGTQKLNTKKKELCTHSHTILRGQTNERVFFCCKLTEPLTLT